jgi:hypothetical protein
VLYGFPSLWRFCIGPGFILNRLRRLLSPTFSPSAIAVPNLLAPTLGDKLVGRLGLADPVALSGVRASGKDFFVNAVVLIATPARFQPLSALRDLHQKPPSLGGWD